MDNQELIKIYQKKSGIYLMAVILFIAIVGFTYFLFFSGSSQVTSSTKYFYIALLAFSIYRTIVEAKSAIKKVPVLTITNNTLDIFDNNKAISLLWLQIIDWKIEIDEGTHYLIIQTHEFKKKINISWLTKKPVEIEEILHRYIKSK